MQNIIIPKNWDDKKWTSQDLVEVLNSVSSDDIANIWEEIETREMVVEELKKLVTTQESQVMLWSEWKIVHIDLPAVGDFKWFQFNYFCSKYAYSLDTFNTNDEYIDNSFTIHGIVEFFTALNDYLRNMWVEMDEKIFADENESKIHPKLEEFQKIITWWLYNSWLKDTMWTWTSMKRASFRSPLWFSKFFRSEDEDVGCLLFKI